MHQSAEERLVNVAECIVWPLGSPDDPFASVNVKHFAAPYRAKSFPENPVSSSLQNRACAHSELPVSRDMGRYSRQARHYNLYHAKECWLEEDSRLFHPGLSLLIHNGGHHQ